jgi:phenylpropionate dioxygenase-like ring-hydroxylating dioxygenase large terminal subunit
MRTDRITDVHRRILSSEENERLTRVGPGTPMGEAFRRYWLPACLAEEIPTPDCPPVRVRLLGEDLVCFRDSNGDVGLVEAFCAHRRAPLFFGRNEECGLRCVYHGWKFDTTGACVDLPSEPPQSRMNEFVRIKAYPTYEAGGAIWTYLGDLESAPPPPEYEWLRVPDDQFVISKTIQACNYLQGIEGGIDTAHVGFLHNENIANKRLLATSNNHPTLEVELTEWGFRYVGIRQITPDQVYVRGYQFLMPCHKIQGQYLNLFGEIPDEGDLNELLAHEYPSVYGHHWVPVDDETTATYNFHYPRDPSQNVPRSYFEAQEARSGRGPDTLIPGTYRLKQNLENDYLIDREVQRTRTFTGIPGVNTQDVAIQEGMGPIVDRSKEYLGTTDIAIVTARELLLEAAREVQEGVGPRGTSPDDCRQVSAADVVIPAGTEWRDVMKSDFTAAW